jgi:hypothetical protein
MRASFRSSFSRKRFGIYQQKSIRTRFPSGDAENGLLLESEEQLHEEAYTWASAILGYGVHYTRQRLYGTLLPSISMFPVVPEFGEDLHNMFQSQDVSALEQAFHKGDVHPSTRDSSGNSLYHACHPSTFTMNRLTRFKVAAYYGRSDFCQLLAQLGIKVDINDVGALPLEWTKFSFFESLSSSRVTDIWRFFTQEVQLLEMRRFEAWSMLYLPLETIVWIWRNRKDVFFGQDTSRLIHLCLRRLLYGLVDPTLRTSAACCLSGEFANEFRTSLIEGSMDFLACLFADEYLFFRSHHSASYDSYETGDIFLDLIAKVGIDSAKACIMMEIEYYRAGHLLVLEEWEGDLPNRRLVFGDNPGVRQKLGWEWVYEEEEAGYLVVNEYRSMAADFGWADSFPFSRVAWKREMFGDETLRRQHNIRFERRSAAKVRKELARMGLKQSRKMPGSWVD